ncbi:MAG: site-specific integrase [Gemmatimonadaceae bacterium]|nr:site-specific integrase [Gemmatimonadaceae bacterium]
MGQERLNFSKRLVEKLPPAPTGKRLYYYDSKVRGLELAVTPSGVKSWRVYRKMHGKPDRIVLGRFPDLSVEQARGKAHEINASLAKGENPAADMRQDLTLRELFLLYLERHSKPHKRSWQGDEWTYNKYLARWSSRRLSTIDRNDVERLHAAIGGDNGKYSANRTLALISSMFNKARGWGWEGRNPATGVRKFKEVKRERFLYGDELPAFFSALKSEGDIGARDAILIMLLSGARKMNVLAMRWEDVNLTRALWTIPLTKSGDSQRVPLVPLAVELLGRRQSLADGSPYVFPGRHGTGHRVEIKAAWDRVRTAANLADVRLHDLRRTLGSWQAAAGVSLPIIGKSLGHKDQNTTMIYARLDLDPVRAAVTTATDALLLAGKVAQ